MINTIKSPKNRPKRILVAEDDPSISHLLSVQLEMEGYEVIQASNGEVAWEQLKKSELPDLVILDVLMPKMDGIEVCRRIRATPYTETLPVVFLTALQGPSNRLEGLEVGANDFLGKPWSKAELYARIRTLIRLKEVQDAVKKQHRQLGLLYDISRELSAYLDLDRMLSLMLTRSAHVVEAKLGSIVLLAEKGLRRKITMNEKMEPEIVTPPIMSPSERVIASWLFKYRRPLMLADAAGKIDFQEGDAIRSLISVPFMLKSQVQGFMIFTHDQPHWFEDDHLELLDSLARQTTISIENAWLFERVQEEQQRFATLISSMDDVVIATGKEQQIILINPAGNQLLGNHHSDFTNKPVAEVLKDTPLLSLFRQVANENRSHTSEISWNDSKELYATVSPVGGGGQVAVIQDISTLKELQSMQLAAEQAETARVRATFERYMSPELVDRVLSRQRGLMEKRERREAAVLFCDMRGFTRLTLRFSPDDVVTILNEFFTVMTSIAYSHNGTVFDIAGDELMVGFGVPFELQDPITAAIRAASEMQTVLASLSQRWWETYGDRRVGMGVGIDYGEVIVGNVGSPTRMNYALVGLPVNTAHALVTTAADGEIRFSEAVMQRFHAQDLDYPITAVSGVRFKGHDQPQIIYNMAIDRPSFPDLDA